MSDPYIGEIRLFAGTFAPRDWLLCEGQTLSIQDNQTLFAILGTTYGGDGRTNFKLPDLRGRVPVGAGDGPGLTPRPAGATGGYERVSLDSSNLPSHNHSADTSVSASMSVSTQQGGMIQPGTGSLLAEGYAKRDNEHTLENYRPAADVTSTVELGGVSSSGSTQLTDAGRSSPAPNLQPFGCVQYIICVEGIFPPRD